MQCRVHFQQSPPPAMVFAVGQPCGLKLVGETRAVDSGRPGPPEFDDFDQELAANLWRTRNTTLQLVGGQSSVWREGDLKPFQNNPGSCSGGGGAVLSPPPPNGITTLQ